FLPGLLVPESLAFAQALVGGAWRPPGDAPSRLPGPPPSPRALAARGLRAVGGLAVPVDQLERLDERLRAGFKPGVGLVLNDADREALGWTAPDAATILRALGFTPVSRGEPTVWRRRNDKAAPAPAPPAPNSPFAALAGFKAAPPRRKRPRRRKPAAS
ncbi:MAG: phosphonate-binding protein, partial [Caulobacterales bacterium]|nr:phosphonate-binding protein [Caulobacterales bacterium]